MASYPYNRVRYLLNLPLDTRCSRQKPVTQSPTTLTGGDHGLYSYRLCIAWKDGDDWLVTNERNSATTNRHIAAVHRVLSMEMQTMGTDTYVRPGKEFVPVTRYRPYQ